MTEVHPVADLRMTEVHPVADLPPKWAGEWHPYAKKFPARSEQEIRALAQDIAENGQAVPCVMTQDGLGLDGRSRFAACKIAGVAPEWVVYDGDKVIERIMSLNLGSRDYTTGQKAMMAAIGLVDLNQRENGKWKYGSVPKDVGDLPHSTWQAALKQAGVVLDYRPELADQVAAGDIALDSAYKDAIEKRNDDEAEAKARAELPPDLLTLVDDGQLTLNHAVRRAALSDIYADRVASGALTLDEAEHLDTRDQRERHDAIQRYVQSIASFLHGWTTAITLIDDPNRPAVLDALSDHDRDRFLEIEQQLKEVIR